MNGWRDVLIEGTDWGTSGRFLRGVPLGDEGEREPILFSEEAGAIAVRELACDPEVFSKRNRDARLDEGIRPAIVRDDFFVVDLFVGQEGFVTRQKPTGTATKKGTPAEARVPSKTQYVFLPCLGAPETASLQATPYEPK
jgi:hypothetical protein